MKRVLYKEQNDMSKKQYKVYVLVKDKQPIYVGCTKNLNNRIKTHLKTKDFDNVVIVKSYDNKLDALNGECAIIRYLSIFKCETILNCLYTGTGIDHQLFNKRLNFEDKKSFEKLSNLF